MERVFEYALAAEKIPLDPSVIERNNDAWVRKKHFRPPPVARTCMKKEYYCPVLRDPSLLPDLHSESRNVFWEDDELIDFDTSSSAKVEGDFSIENLHENQSEDWWQ